MRTVTAAERRCAVGFSTRSAGPPSAVTICWNRSAAVPSARAAARRLVADSRSVGEAAENEHLRTERQHHLGEPGVVARTREPVDRLVHLQRVAGSVSEHLVHVGQDRVGPQPGADCDIDDAAGELFGAIEVGHECAVAERHVHHQGVETGRQLLRQDRCGDQRDRFHRCGHVTNRIQPPVGRSQVGCLADDGATRPRTRPCGTDRCRAGSGSPGMLSSLSNVPPV